MTALLVAMLACAGAVITVNEIQQADRSSHRNPGFGVDCCAIVDIDGDSRPLAT